MTFPALHLINEIRRPQLIRRQRRHNKTSRPKASKSRGWRFHLVGNEIELKKKFKMKNEKLKKWVSLV